MLKTTNNIINNIMGHIIDHSLTSVDPFRLITRRVSVEKNFLVIDRQRIDLRPFERIHVLGAGKGAVSLFNGLETLLGDRIHGGIIVSVEAHAFSHPNVRFYPGAHPVPGSRSLAAGEATMQYIKNNVGERDLVIFLMTGGASSLLVLPYPPLQLEDKINVTRVLLESGAGIDEINCVRKHLSLLKGGRLAEMISPAVVVSFILSDVIDSPLDSVGSGLSVGDSTSFADASAVIQRYGLEGAVGKQVMNLIQKGINGEIADTPLPGAEIFSRNRHFLLGDNLTALTAARKAAESTGIPVYILTSADHGEASEAAKVYAALVKEIIRSGSPFPAPVLLLSGGEFTVTVKGKGKGGRNQEFILAMLEELKGVRHPFSILSMGSDGIDGPTDAAGAWIDEHTMSKVKAKNLDIRSFLKENNSYEFFELIDGLIKTGPTGTNVMDIRLFFIPDAKGKQTL